MIDIGGMIVIAVLGGLYMPSVVISRLIHFAYPTAGTLVVG